MGGGVGHLVLSGPLILAVPVAAAAGAVTFLSPCVLPLVHGYLSYAAGMSGADAQARPEAHPAGGRSGGDRQAAAGAAETGGGGDGSGGTAVKVTAAAAASRGRSRTVAGTALFVLGFSVVFASEGVAFGGLGAVLRTHATGLTQILGVVTIFLGLMFAGVFDR